MPPTTRSQTKSKMADDKNQEEAAVDVIELIEKLRQRIAELESHAEKTLSIRRDDDDHGAAGELSPPILPLLIDHSNHEGVITSNVMTSMCPTTNVVTMTSSPLHDRWPQPTVAMPPTALPTYTTYSLATSSTARSK